MWPWQQHHRFLCVLATPYETSGYRVGRKYFQAREKNNWEGFLKAFVFSSNLWSPKSYPKPGK